MFGYYQTLKRLGISYLGNVTQSTKMRLSYNDKDNPTMTYNIYLAPATLARDEKHPNLNVCPFSKNCAKSCLNGSGHNKCDILARGIEHSKTNISRIKKTHLFYDEREVFMSLLIHELKRYKEKSKLIGMDFSVRLNCTSDLSPELFKINGVNILEMFPNVKFYDYTKEPKRLKIQKKYDNYDVTFSFDGENWDICEKYLKQGGKVAVVFDCFDNNKKQILPKFYKGYKVIDGNTNDMRYLNEGGTIIGLHYHRVADNYKNGYYEDIETPFIVKANKYCIF
jgi:hypothetical protein